MYIVKIKWLLAFIICLVLLSTTTISSAFITTHYSTDVAMTNIAFEAEGRIGDRGGLQTYELDIGPTTSSPFQTAQYDWPNGTPVPFTLSYDNISNLVTFTVGSNTLTYTPTQMSMDIFLRTRAVNNNTSILVDNLVLNGTPIGESSNAFIPGSSGIDILQISDAALSNGFTLTGQSTMTWAGSPPYWSKLSFQIKVATGKADLALVKTDAPDPVNVGQNLTYTLNITNNGPCQANGVTVTDYLPSDVTFVSAVPAQGSCDAPLSGSHFGGNTNTSPLPVICSLGSLAVGANTTVTIIVTPTTAGVIYNTAIVSSADYDKYPSNNTASNIPTTVNPATDNQFADLSITKIDSPDPVIVGNSLLYTINVTNNGPAPANNVTVTDALHANVTYVSASPSQGSCSGTTTVICNIGTLANGASASVLIVVTPNVTGTIDNTATVSADEGDPDLSNNTSLTEYTAVIAAPSGDADLSVTKIDSPDPVIVGDSLLYTISVTNNGPAPANNVTVTDTLHANVSYVSATPSQGSCSGTTTVICNLGTLANGASASVLIVVTPNVTGTIDNTATVSADEGDPDLLNNTSLAEYTAVIAAPSGGADLSVTKTDFPDPVALPGDPLTYTITVTNNGPSTATGVILSDVLHSSLTFVSVSTTQGSCSESGGTVSCTIGTMSNGASVTVIIDTITSIEGIIDNTVLVSGDETDPDTANNSGVETTIVGDVSRLLSISTRSYVGTGENREIGGFIIGGSLPKQLLIRGRGPSMSGAPFNIGGTLSNPYVRLRSSSLGAYIAQNDNWGDQSDTLCSDSGFVCGTPTDITATGLDPCIPNPGQLSPPPGCSNESAILITVPPGAYTAVLSGVNSGTGVGLIEVFDLDGSTLPKLVAISTRALVLTGDSRMIGGFIIGAGNGSKQVLLRARGSSMSGPPFNITGTLTNPYLRLHSSALGAYIAQNDNWGDQSDALCSTSGFVCGTPAEITATGMDPCIPNPGESTAPPGCTEESAILITVPPGPYTAVVSGVDNTTGVGLVEIIEVGE